MLPDSKVMDGVNEIASRFGQGLHSLCQPLTTLQCRLYLGVMDQEMEPMQELLSQCLTDCEQVMSCVRELQNQVYELKPGTGDAE